MALAKDLEFWVENDQPNYANTHDEFVAWCEDQQFFPKRSFDGNTDGSLLIKTLFGIE